MARASRLVGSPKATGAVALLSVGLFLAVALACVVALAGLGLLKPDTRPLDAILLLWTYRDHRDVARQLSLGGLVGGLAFGSLVVAVIRSRPVKLHGDARWATSRQISAAQLRGQDGVILGRRGGALLRASGDEHILVSAPTRSGKSAGIVIPTLLSWSGSVVVLDIKREAWEATAGFRRASGRRVLLFDPFDAQGRTVRFNPLDGVERTDTASTYDRLHRLAQFLFPDQPRSDPFWTEAPRNAFIALGLYVAKTPKLSLTLGEIVRQASGGDLAERLTNDARRRRGSDDALGILCERLISDFCQTSPNTFSSIRQSLTSRLGLWLNPRVDDATSVSEFSIEDLLGGRADLYLATGPADLERAGPLYSLMIQHLLDGASRKSPPSQEQGQVLFLLDEFASLGRAPTLARAFSWIAGYGVRLVCVVQTPSQLRAAYGEAAEEIIANCAFRVHFAPASLKDARELSEMLGAYSLKASTTTSPSGLSGGRRSRTQSEQRRPLLLPQELLQLDRDAVIVQPRGRPPVLGRRLHWKDERCLAGRFRPAPVLQTREPKDEEGGAVTAAVRQSEAGNLALRRVREGEDLARTRG